MAKINVDDWIAGLKHLAMYRVTYYDNRFPCNCGEINPDGSISFDCIGLIKSTINEPDIAYKTGPSGYYVVPGQVIADGADEIGILNLCTGVEWHRFTHAIKGSYLYMAGHAGVFCGAEFQHGNGIVNTIECTTDFGDNGVTTSWMDVNTGRRYDHKGGTEWRSWEAFGNLTPYIDYGSKPTPEPTPTPEPGKTEFTYQVWDDMNEEWLPNVTNDADYAGIFGSDVDCVYVSCNDGNVHYAVHTWGGDTYEHYPSSEWLPEVKNREDYAGLFHRPIDAFILKSDKTAKYRVHLRKSNQWLDFVKTSDADYNDPEYGYAGIIGEPIDAIEIMPA